MNPIPISESLAPVGNCLSLGEVMLRLRSRRKPHSRQHACSKRGEGGGEYNVARGLRRCFGLRTAVATALAENAVRDGWWKTSFCRAESITSLLKWVSYDGVGRTVRNGLNFTERGFGVRAAAGCSDRGTYGHQPSEAGRLRLGSDLRRGQWGAVVSYGRHLRGALRFNGQCGCGGDGGRAPPWNAGFVRT